MVRTLYRIACIGAVAALVGGAVFFLVEGVTGAAAHDGDARLRERGTGRWQDSGERPAARDAEDSAQTAPWVSRGGDVRRPAARSRHGRRGDHGAFSLGRGLGGLGLTSVQLGTVAAVVAGLRKRRRGPRATPAPLEG